MTIITDGLKYYWNVKDGIKSGNALNNIAPSGASSSLAMMGNASYDSVADAIYLDAVSGYLEVPNNSVFNSSTSFTYEYIYDSKAVEASGYRIIIGDGAYMDVDFTNNGVYWQLMEDNSGRIPFTAVNGDIDTQQRMHVVVQYDRVAQIVRGYVNGTLRLTSTGVNQNLFFSRTLSEPVRFSKMAADNSLPVNFRSFRFYDRALTSTEIADNFSNGDSLGLENPDASTLPALSNLSPVNNLSTISTAINISATVTDAESHVSTVYLEVSRTQDFAVLTHNLSIADKASGSTATFALSNLTGGNYYWRMRASRTNYTTYTAYTPYYGLYINAPSKGLLYPDALLLQTGYTGAVTAIDESPDTPDANWLTTVTTPTADTILRASFPSPPRNLSTGAGLQKFRVRIRKNKTTSSTGTYRVAVYESNVLKGSEQSFTIASGGTQEQIVTFTWDASLLSAISGANVEIRSVGNGYTGNSTTATRFGVNIGAIEWEYSASPEAQVTAPDASDTTPPSVTIVSVSKTVLSPVSGMDSSVVTFSFNEDVSEWRIVRAGVSYDTGTIVESGGAVSADTNIQATILHTDLNNTEGASRFNIYARDSAGNWVNYTP